MTRQGIRWNGDAALGAIRAAAVRGVRLGAEHLLQVSNTRVPIEEGTLERSGVVSVDEGEVTAAVSYDTPYAVRQHEELDYRHDAGRTAKFLERSLHEENGTITEIIAAQVRRAVQ
ncbi:hypothetical protein [Streptomyces nigra]|uniref:hypothetical protein n=1 Tax=Streptomyces nigra TaxID=1827580 RepID=UPI00381855BF